MIRAFRYVVFFDNFTFIVLRLRLDNLNVRKNLKWANLPKVIVITRVTFVLWFTQDIVMVSKLLASNYVNVGILKE